MDTQNRKLHWQQVIKHAAWYFLIAITGCMAVGWPVYETYRQSRDEVLLNREWGYLDMAERMVKKEFFETIGDLSLLAQEPALVDFLEQRSTLHRKRLSHYLQQVPQTYRRYVHLKLFDLDGRELIRINHYYNQSEVMTDSALEDIPVQPHPAVKAGVGAGQFYVSALAFNTDPGEIEIPAQPVVQFSTLVLDSQGQKIGIMQLDFRATELLDAFKQLMAREPSHHAVLLHQTGHELGHYDPSDDAASIFSNADKNFVRSHPLVWKKIANTNADMVRTREGLFLFRKIKLLQFNDASQPFWASSGTSQTMTDAKNPGDWWTAVVWVPQNTMLPDSLLQRTTEMGLIVVFFAISLLLCALIAERTVRILEHRERQRLDAEKIADLYDNAPCGYHSLNADGVVIRINLTELAWLGYRRSEVEHQLSLPDLLDPSSHAAFQKAFHKLRRGAGISDLSLRMRRKDGSTLPVTLNTSAVLNEQGDLLYTRTTVFNMTERDRLQAELEHKANTDGLTGLCNRRRFFELGQHALAQATQQHRPVAVMMLDIDHFKRVNDQHGHAAGDQVLTTMASVMAQQLRDTDIVGRLGGEEFAILLPDTPLPVAQEMAEQVRLALSRTEVPLNGGLTLAFTVSIGITGCGASGCEMDELLRRADEALYQAKNAGRNRVCVA